MALIVDHRTSFALPAGARMLSAARSSRQSDTADLQEKFFAIIPRLPQVALRGHCEKSDPGLDSYLISSVPIRGLLSKADLTRYNFLARLYLTVSSAFNHAALHAREIEAAEKMVLSFHSLGPIGGSMTEADTFRLLPGFFRDPSADPGLPIRSGETFPRYSLKPSLDLLVAQLRYGNRPYRDSLQDAVSRKLDVLFFMRRDAIVYRDALKLLINLFGRD